MNSCELFLWDVDLQTSESCISWMDHRQEASPSWLTNTSLLFPRHVIFQVESETLKNPKLGSNYDEEVFMIN